jgi:hypothetical protein
MTTRQLYARKGEMVHCENGHQVGAITRDLFMDEVLRGDEIEGISVEMGKAFPRCPHCGAWFTWQRDNSARAGFLFADGMRTKAL